MGDKDVTTTRRVNKGIRRRIRERERGIGRGVDLHNMKCLGSAQTALL
jgi:hypothetical protein